ncbi:MAG TPA: hypothetical protein VEA16_07185, partial [Vicinamibacterales bacterium]|nr:hypothetical protein [Vicinamibacterales bacterium]
MIDSISPENPPRREKIRSAWIAFVGRIVAQLIGAVATVTLGAIVLGGWRTPDRPAEEAAPTVLVATPVRTHGETVIVMLPVGKDGTVNEATALGVAESFGNAKALARADARLQTPIDRRVR